MNSKVKSNVVKGGAKTANRPRHAKDEEWKPVLDNSKKKSSTRREAAEVQQKRTDTGKAPLVQQKAQVPTSGWIKGGSSLSFVDIVRKKAESATLKLSEEPATATATVTVTATPNTADTATAASAVVPVETPEVDVIPNGEVIASEPFVHEPEEVTYEPVHMHHIPEGATIPVTFEEEVEETTLSQFYVLEINRVGDDMVVLPPETTRISIERLREYTFSGQAGKPPTPPTARQVQPHFYRPDGPATRPFGGMTGAAENNRNTSWVAQPSHSAEYINWSLPERHPRNSYQGLQYNSYAPPNQQQQQRNFVHMPNNRMRQQEMLSDAPLRGIRDNGVPSAFNRHSENGGGVW